jgi:hypothetical protein
MRKGFVQLGHDIKAIIICAYPAFSSKLRHLVMNLVSVLGPYLVNTLTTQCRV